MEKKEIKIIFENGKWHLYSKMKRKEIVETLHSWYNHLDGHAHMVDLFDRMYKTIEEYRNVESN